MKHELQEILEHFWSVVGGRQKEFEWQTIIGFLVSTEHAGY